MRESFIKTLIGLAKQDERIVLLTGDLGYLVIEEFATAFPNRFYNVGVAEQNMIGIATGLAEAGFLPFCYSITTFASLRPFEFIRNGPVLHRLPVRIISVGGGYEYGSAGHTHHGIEDIGVMRTQNGLYIVAPADYEQSQTVLAKTWDLPEPIYYRLGKNNRDLVQGLNGAFELGQVQVVAKSEKQADILFIAMGSVALNLAEAIEGLAAQGVVADAAVLASIAPAPIDTLRELLPKYKLVVSVEAHSLQGGIGSLLSEIIVDYGIKTRLIRNAVKETPDGRSGSNAYLNAKHLLDAKSLIKTGIEGLKGY